MVICVLRRTCNVAFQTTARPMPFVQVSCLTDQIQSFVLSCSMDMAVTMAITIAMAMSMAMVGGKNMFRLP